MNTLILPGVIPFRFARSEANTAGLTGGNVIWDVAIGDLIQEKFVPLAITKTFHD